MIKLLIADDERIICETIASIIDWKKYNIEIIGTCLNGIEAYDLIMDEFPQIVITDIRMPGLDGLELIRRVTDLDMNTQFILLSGFSEFEYAQKAMKYGVKHYLLKPCNEKQILNAVRKASVQYYENQQTRKIKASQFVAVNSMRHNIFSSIINDALYLEQSYKKIISTYEPYMDFYTIPYRIFYIYYLEQNSANYFLNTIEAYFKANLPQVSVYGIYVCNTFSLFVQDFTLDYITFMNTLKKLHFPNQRVTCDIQTEPFPDLYTLLTFLLSKIKRYSSILYMNDFHLLHACNYSSISQRIEALYEAHNRRDKNALQQIIEVLNNISDITFFRQLTSSLLFKIISNNSELPSIDLTKWLLQTDSEKDLEHLKEIFVSKLKELLLHMNEESKPSPTTWRICQYISQNLDDPNLTLKKISESYLFMNVDYVSKKFQKDMNIKFSKYLTSKRIQRAKAYFDEDPFIKIQDVAEKVGYGSNPQYFSQLFKKVTGMTPSTYVSLKNADSNPS